MIASIEAEFFDKNSNSSQTRKIPEYCSCDFDLILRSFFSQIEEAKQEHYTKKYEDNNINTTYKSFKIIGNAKNSPNHVNIAGSKITDREEIANKIGKFFSEVGNANKKKSNKKQKKIKTKTKITESDNIELNKEITIEEINDICKNLPEKKAGGPDGIMPFMIKNSNGILNKSLKQLYNESFSSNCQTMKTHE